jgi:hypothetical protein
MTSRRFPRSPEITPRPFDGGPNPFADDVAPPIPFSENPLAGPISGEVQPFKPVDYEQTQSDRSARVLLLGVVGASFIGVSLMIAIIVMLNTAVWAEELVYCWPANLMGLALCIPACIMAKNDLQAMRAGVMEGSGLRRIRIAYWCGSLGTLIGILPFIFVVIAIVLAIVG